MRRWLTISTLLTTGVLLAFFGAFVEEDSYGQDLLLNVGVTVVLFALLYLIQVNLLERVERVREETHASVEQLSTDVDRVRAEVQETKTRLDALGDLTRQALAAEQEADQSAFDRFDEGLSLESTLAILERALELQSVSPNGPRMRIPYAHAWLRFSRVGENPDGTYSPAPLESDNASSSGATTVIVLLFEDIEGSYVADGITWRPGKSAVEIMAEVAKTLQRMGIYPGDEVFDAQELFSKFKSIISIAISRRRRGQLPVGAIVEIPREQWAITTDGLDCLSEPYFIERDRFHLEDWRSHMSNKVWIDRDDFEEAFNIAERLLRR